MTERRHSGLWATLGAYAEGCVGFLEPFRAHEHRGGWLVGGGCLTWVVIGGVVLTWWMVKYTLAAFLICAMVAAGLPLFLAACLHEGALALSRLWRE